MGSKARVLVVEDENDICDLIKLHLTRAQFTVETVSNGEEALKRIRENPFDLLVLDWMLPGLSGVELTRMVREGPIELKTSRKVSILMVTAKAESRDIVEGLEAGADDYLTKPFEPSVLVARVRSLLRRSQVQADRPRSSSDEGVLRFGSIELHRDQHEVHRNGEKLSLTLSEFRLLAGLAENQGKVLTRDKLIQMVQGDDIAVTHRTVDTHVFGLRKKLGKDADLIETIRGVGYRIRLDG